MKRNLTRSDILRRNCDIAELFPKKWKQSNAKNARNFAPAALGKSDAKLLEIRQICLALQPNELKNTDGKASPATLLRCSASQTGLRLCLAVRHSSNRADKVFISPARRLGSAVMRNRAKRLQREFYRHSRGVLRTISQHAAERAGFRLCRDLLSHAGISISAKVLLAAWLNLEQTLSYHCALIILNPAPQRQTPLSDSAVHPAIIGLERFWACDNQSDFGRELHRYQLLLAGLERILQQKWLDYLQYALLRFRDWPVLGKYG